MVAGGGCGGGGAARGEGPGVRVGWGGGGGGDLKADPDCRTECEVPLKVSGQGSYQSQRFTPAPNRT